MSPESDWTSQVAGCRAVGALALEVADCRASHRNHRNPFASGGPPYFAEIFPPEIPPKFREKNREIHPRPSGGAWLDLATRVQSLAYPEGRTRRSSSFVSEELQGELQSVAMAAVANVAGLEHVCNRWLADAVLTARRALDEPMNNDIHVKREALRAVSVLDERDIALAQ